MGTEPITVCGARLLADHSGALYWPDRRLMVVADLHLGKGASYAARGQPLPPHDTAATLARLAGALDRFDPALLVCLGDSFHNPAAPARLADEDRAAIRRLTGGRDWLWIAGNHDPAPPDWLGGRVAAAHAAAPLSLCHEAPSPWPVGGVCGHYHPKARVRTRGRTIGGRCFVTDGWRLMLPAFGAFAGGLDVTAPAISSLFAGRFEVMMIGPRRLHRFASGALHPARAA